MSGTKPGEMMSEMSVKTCCPPFQHAAVLTKKTFMHIVLNYDLKHFIPTCAYFVHVKSTTILIQRTRRRSWRRRCVLSRTCRMDSELWSFYTLMQPSSQNWQLNRKSDQNFHAAWIFFFYPWVQWSRLLVSNEQDYDGWVYQTSVSFRIEAALVLCLFCTRVWMDDVKSQNWFSIWPLLPAGTNSFDS